MPVWSFIREEESEGKSEEEEQGDGTRKVAVPPVKMALYAIMIVLVHIHTDLSPGSNRLYAYARYRSSRSNRSTGPHFLGITHF